MKRNDQSEQRRQSQARGSIVDHNDVRLEEEQASVGDNVPENKIIGQQQPRGAGASQIGGLARQNPNPYGGNSNVGGGSKVFNN